MAAAVEADKAGGAAAAAAAAPSTSRYVDPLDSPEFDPQEFINRLFPTGASLWGPPSRGTRDEGRGERGERNESRAGQGERDKGGSSRIGRRSWRVGNGSRGKE